MRGIALDLDGTLLNSAKEVSERSKQALLACKRAGIRVIYATGRPPRSVRQLLPPELLADASFVYYNGGLVEDPAAGIEVHTPIERGAAGAIIDYASELQQGIRISLESKDVLYSNRAQTDKSFFSRWNEPTICTPDAMRLLPATKIMFTDFGDAEPLLREACGASARFIGTDGGRLIQLMHASVSKASGIGIVIGHYGIAPSDLVVFGDDHNDADMFAMPARAVAMGNAVDELKAIADEVTGTNDEDGVATVLERLLSS